MRITLAARARAVSDDLDQRLGTDPDGPVTLTLISESEAERYELHELHASFADRAARRKAEADRLADMIRREVGRQLRSVP